MKSGYGAELLRASSNRKDYILLKGVKVCLTEVRADDREVLFRWINDPETARFNGPYLPIDWTSHRAWFDSIGRCPSHVAFAIRPKDEPTLLGITQLVGIHTIHRSAEARIRLGTEHRDHGFGTDALFVLLRTAFYDLNLQRVWTNVHATNVRALRAYEKAGFVREGVLRQAVYIAGRWDDVVVMAALRGVT